MPIKEFMCQTPECLKKDQVMEVFVSINESNPNCEICTVPLSQVFSSTPFVNTYGCSPASRKDTH